MKYLIGFLLLALNGCASQKQKAPETLVTIERTPCLGKCPTYTLSIFANGTAIYNGSAHVLRMGKASLKLSQTDFKAIRQSLESLPFDSYLSSYGTPIRDIPFVIINHKGKQVKIVQGNAPKELQLWIRELERKLEITTP